MDSCNPAKVKILSYPLEHWFNVSFSLIRRSLLPVVLLFSSLSTFAEQQWIEVRSPHFSVATDGGEKRAQQVALRFEQMRMAFGALFQKVTVNTAPLEIIAFRNNKELRQFSPLYGGKPIELAGFFLGNGGHGGPGASEDSQYIALDLSAEDNWGTVFHEYAHLLINTNFPPSPVWFDEGFAEYCASLKVDKKEIALGLIKPELSELLAQSQWLKLIDLFSVEHDSKIYNRDDRRSVFYAQSWLTVHFLMSKNMMRQFDAYARLVRDGRVPVAEAIRRGFGMEPEALDKAVQSYYRGNQAMSFHMATPPGGDNVTFTSHLLDDLAVKTVLADLDYHARDYRQRGIAELQEILSKQPDNVVANRNLGFEALQHQDFDKAREMFTRAAAQDVKDPRVHYLLAMMLSRNDADDNLEAIKKELKAAIALDPSYADAYNLLGITLSTAGETAEAVEALKHAIALRPRDSYYSGNLVSVYMRAQDFDNALPLLEELQKSSEPAIAAMAAQQLQQVQAYKTALKQREGYMHQVEPAAEPPSAREVSDADLKHTGPAPVEPPKTAAPGHVEPVLFMKGILVSVDCSSAPAATLTISSAGKKWKMLAPQAKKLIVMGADELSCSWTNRKVSMNYRKSGENQGTLVSLELE
jgi:Flp pilus assembly protein TadD